MVWLLAVFAPAVIIWSMSLFDDESSATTDPMKDETVESDKSPVLLPWLACRIQCFGCMSRHESWFN